ncbi:MAG TPA: ribosome assembly RNA-binding protein YhbY [Longimicrobiales bacterium]|nr:ribosome assembly RNA-binding protein YhbY [Longimicrobiales bacterium]
MLTSRQRAHLKRLAHPLKPILQIGKEGASPEAIKAVEDALNTRELLKFKVLEAAPQSARETGEAVAAGIPNAEVVQVIGRTVILYRPHPENPTIRLPD